jgi:hypothetical protein
MQTYLKHIEAGLSEASINLVLTEQLPERFERGPHSYCLRFPTHTLTTEELVTRLAQNLVETYKPIEMRRQCTHLFVNLDLEIGMSNAMLLTPVQ